jgi:hypothetical protein
MAHLGQTARKGKTKRRMFFSEEKNQKTFVPGAREKIRTTASIDEAAER